ncbi:ATP-binding cassette domain-containing protein [Embleya sp. NBC_00896]|uniref:ATP-binding cassette domain-containing protein n=1 Tax=Embleya sp. NBC_00896 TaxID=2975961 RepID=UPI0038636E47|nr:ATP-binding cassette domain-containing protein [Embleya sp. NBC_00896]
MRTTNDAVLAEGLTKRYGDTHALDDFDLTVPRGTVQGLLGPNGAGKTTAVRILSTLLRPDGGRALVAGHDVVREARHVRRRIGFVGQYAALDESVTGRRNLTLFGRLFHLDKRHAARRADELLERFSLTEAADKGVKEYSGGMRRRLDLAASMILAPEVLFLDEPTTGLDPRGRNEVWEAVRSLIAGGTAVLLTTQYLDEADKLADRIAVIDRGRKIADDTPDRLKREFGGDRIEVVVRESVDVPRAVRVVAGVAVGGVEPVVAAEERRVTAPVDDRVAALTRVARELQDDGIVIEDIGVRQPTLDEVFLRLTGHRAHETGPEEEKDRDRVEDKGRDKGDQDPGRGHGTGHDKDQDKEVVAK